MTPVKAIRAKCLDCYCGQYKEVELCPCSDCPLYPFRFGKNPNIKREVTPEQLAALEKARLLKKSMSCNSEKNSEAATGGKYTPQATIPVEHGAEGGKEAHRW